MCRRREAHSQQGSVGGQILFNVFSLTVAAIGGGRTGFEPPEKDRGAASRIYGPPPIAGRRGLSI